MNNKYKNIANVKAIERKNEQKLLAVNPKLDNGSGIYILWRTEVHAYVGQSVGLLTRLAQHLAGYSQHIDLSMKAHKLYSSDNPYGYRIDFIHCDQSWTIKSENISKVHFAERRWNYGRNYIKTLPVLWRGNVTDSHVFPASI